MNGRQHKQKLEVQGGAQQCGRAVGRGLWWPCGSVPRLAHCTTAEVTLLPGTPAPNLESLCIPLEQNGPGSIQHVVEAALPSSPGCTFGCIAACVTAPVELPCWARSRRPASDLRRKTHSTKQLLLHNHPLTLWGHSELYNAWQIFPSRSRSCLPV